MTGAARRVAALAAVFAPARAGALLCRLAGGGPADALAQAAALAGATRRERLRALAGALSPDPLDLHARAETAARGERARVAEVVRAVASGESVADGVSPVLVRLCREAIGR